MKKYRLKRVLKVQKINDYNNWTKVGSILVILQAVNESGKWEDIKNYNDEIGRILPDKLHNYFFFNGERIEWIQRPINRKQFTDSITLLVGDETFNRAIRHLHGAKRKLEEEQQSLGDATTKHLYEEKREIEEQLEEIQKRIEDHDKNIEGYQITQKKISEELRAEGGEITKLEEQRVQLTLQKEKTRETLKDNRQSITSLISEKGYQVFSQDAIKKILKSVNGLIESGQIPTPYKASFVRELLHKEECICERPLKYGEKPYTAVEEWLNKANMSAYEETAIRLKGQFEDIEKEIPNVFANFDREQKERERLLSEIRTTDEEIDKIGEKLKNSNVEKARRLEAKLNNLKDLIEELTLKKGEDIRDLKVKEKEKKDKEEEIQKREAKSEKEKQIKNEILLTNLAISEIENRRELMRQEHRLDLERRIDRIFNAISYKPFQVKLSRDYTLSLVGPDGVVGKSTSESQILSLSFIGALIEQIREFTANRELVGLSSSQYPLVMDSPFGSLGEAYQLNSGELLSSMADQIVILVSKSQWEGNIQQTISSNVGKHYVVSYYTPKDTKREVTVEINGNAYPLVKRCAGDEDYIEILEV